MCRKRPIPGVRLFPYERSASPSGPVVSITRPSANESFTVPASVTISAVASGTAASITKVEFYNGTTKLGEDTSAPYSYAWNNVPAGNYTVKVKAYDGAGGSAMAEVNITVNTAGSDCTASGSILREMWTGISNNDAASIPTDSSPDAVSELSIFEDPVNAGDNFGTRVSGYLCIPTTGTYTFWISSNDHSELWLSTDADRLNRRRIAWVTGFTNPREWTKFASQKSAAINLVKGQIYYIEALHKEGVGSDHMAVGWQLPGGTLERPIPGSRLSPFESNNASASSTSARMSVDSESVSKVDESFYILPNPAPGGSTRITLHGEKASVAAEKTVQLIGMTGEILHQQTIRSQDMTNNVDQTTIELIIGRELKPGLYLINVISNDHRSTMRLLVK